MEWNLNKSAFCAKCKRWRFVMWCRLKGGGGSGAAVVARSKMSAKCTIDKNTRLKSGQKKNIYSAGKRRALNLWRERNSRAMADDGGYFTNS